MTRILLIETTACEDLKHTQQDLKSLGLSESTLRSISEREGTERAAYPKRTVIEGVFQWYDKLNANKRVYPKAVWEKQLDENGPVMQALAKRAMVGHIEHPADGATDFTKGAILVTKLWMREDGAIMGRALVYRNADGDRLQEYLDTGTLIGISSRGTGSIDDAGTVQEDYALDSFDIVARPSTYGAYPAAVNRPREDAKLGDRVCVIASKTKARENDRALLKQHNGEVVGEVVKGDRGLYRFNTPEDAAAFAKAIDGTVMPHPAATAGATHESIAESVLAAPVTRNTPMTLADILKKLVEASNALIADAKSTKEARTKTATELRSTIMVGEVSEDLTLKDALDAAKVVATKLETMTSGDVPATQSSGVPAPVPTARQAPDPATTQAVGTNSGGVPMCKEHLHSVMGSDGKCPLCVSPGPNNKDNTNPGPTAPDKDKANAATPASYGNYEKVISDLRDLLKEAGAKIVTLTSEKETLAASNAALLGENTNLKATVQQYSESSSRADALIATLTSVDVAGQVAAAVEAVVLKHPALAEFRDTLAVQASPVAVEAKAARLLRTIEDKRKTPATGGTHTSVTLENRLRARRSTIAEGGQHPMNVVKSDTDAGNVTEDETPIPVAKSLVEDKQRKSVNLAAGAIAGMNRKAGLPLQKA